ncbi:MAG: hypothetical protein RLZZ206_3160 [Cyanobacteriota bacterium]
MVVLSQESAGLDGGIDAPGLDPPAIDPPGPVLVPFSFWLSRAACAAPPADPQAPSTSPQPDPPDPPDPTALRGAIDAHLAGLGWACAEPLRWAITAVDPLRGLQLEGVGVSQGQSCQPERQ